MEDIKYLNNKDVGTLAKWWCKLNRWEWPSEIPNEEKPGKENNRRKILMEKIESTIGMKACNREWNNDMTDEEHESFWRRCGKRITKI